MCSASPVVTVALSFAGVMSSAMEYNPLIPIYDENGNYALNPDRPDRPNPVSMFDAKDKSQKENILATANLEITPLQGLLIKASVGTDIRINERNSYTCLLLSL